MVAPKKPISDISPPGKTPAAPGSRPVIKPSDEPVIDTVVNQVDEAPVAVIKKHNELRIQPLSDSQANQPDTSEVDDKPSSPEPAAEASTSSTKPRLGPISDTFNSNQDESNDDPMPVAKDRSTSETQINEYIEKKTYFVPIGKSKLQARQRQKLNFMLLLILLAILADAALYFGYIELPF